MSSYIGPLASFTAGAAAPTIQRRLRKMSTYPREPRVFSQAKIFLPVGGIGVFLLGLTVIALATSDEASRPDDATLGIIFCSIAIIPCLWFLWMGLARRFGVDNEKVWSRFAPVFYREIYFSDITRITFDNLGFRLYNRQNKFLGVAINRFDYTLAYLRILEELKYRRFTVGDVAPRDPRWPQAAQELRNALASEAYRNHQNYYDNHPAELHELTALAQGR